MNRKSTNKLWTAVHTLVICSFAFSPTYSMAAETTMTNEQFECSKADDPAACMKENRALREQQESSPCSKEGTKAYRDALSKLGEACSKAGFNSQNCVADIKECDSELKEEDLGSEEFNTTAVLSTVTGVPMNVQTVKKTQCPQLSGTNYFKRKSEIEKDLKEDQEDLTKLEEEKADIEEKFNETMQDTQKEIRQAQQDLADKKLEIAESKRTQKAEFAKQQADTASQVRQKNMQLLQLRGKLIKSDRDKAMNLMKLTEATAKRACYSSVKKMHDDMVSSTKKYTIKEATRVNSEVSASFDDCMKTFDQQRAALNESYRQEQAELNETISQLQSDIDDMENQLQLAKTQLAEMETDATTKQTTAEQNLTRQLSEAQQKMTSANTTMQKRLSALSAKQFTVKQRINQKNNELAALGAQPQKADSELAPQEAISKMSGEIDTIQEYEQSCRAQTKSSTGKVNSEKSGSTKKEGQKGGR